jgi:tripartite-type tricarboxylate transporter receptor subunit TctC
VTNLARSIAAVSVLAISLCTAAADFPTRPIRIVIPFPTGGPTDVAGRVIAQALSQTIGQPVVIENRPGADGAIGPDVVLKSSPDGHTLLMGTSSSMAAVPAMRKKPPYDPVVDFVPITFLGRLTLILVVQPKVPATTVSELIAYARANPGKLNVAAANPPSIFAMAQLKSIAKLDMVNVTYKGDMAAMPDLVSGRVDVLVAGLNVVHAQVKEGKLRALATLSETRSRLAPDVPTMAEAGVPRFAIYPWVGLFAPAGVPKDVVDRLSREVNAVLKRAEVLEQLDKVAFEASGSTPQELASIVKSQLKVWGDVAREAGIQSE